MSLFCGPMLKWEDTTHFDEEQEGIGPHEEREDEVYETDVDGGHERE